MKDVIDKIRAMNPISEFDGKATEEVWSDFVATLPDHRRSHRRVYTFAAVGLSAVTTAIVLIMGNVATFSPSTNAAAAQLTKIADSIQIRSATVTLAPGQYDYLSYRVSGDASIKYRGRWIHARQIWTYAQLTQPRSTRVSGMCQMVTHAEPLHFFDDGKRVWNNLGRPRIGVQSSDVIRRHCGRLDTWGDGVTPPPFITPATVLRAIQSVQKPIDESQTFLGLTAIDLLATPSPELRRAILIDMAKLSGVKALGTATDALGRNGEAFSYAIPANSRCLGSGCGPYTESIILNPKTGALQSITSNQGGGFRTQTILGQYVMKFFILNPKTGKPASRCSSNLDCSPLS